MIQQQPVNDTQLATTSQWLPAMSIADVVERRNLMVEFVKAAMTNGVDFGVIPGTQKPTLLKPGAEKLCTLFGLTTHFQIIESEKDWNGSTHGGEPFFYFLYRASLYRGDMLIAESDGSCSSMEKKYRWRNSERICPTCGKPTIIKGKQEYGGGYICFAKKGGCGAKFTDDEKSITEQIVGQIANPDIADQVNTIQKMAQKRALIAATLLAVNASEFFTQDIEDMTIAGTFVEVPQPAKSVPVQVASAHTWSDALVERITKDVAYFCGNEARVRDALVKMEARGAINARMPDHEVYDKINEVANARANQYAASSGK